MEDFSFYIVTDTHYYNPSLGTGGTAYEEYMQGEQMCLAENSVIAEAVFAQLARDSSVKTVIMPGDLSKDGEKASHTAFLQELKKLSDCDKDIFVITARHDFNDCPHGFDGDSRPEVEGTERSELYSMYYEYGYSTAIAFDEPSLSYVAQLTPKIRMLAINCDGDDKQKGLIDDRLEVWILEQIKKAHDDNCFMFAINHYPIIPPAPIFKLIEGDSVIKNWMHIASLLADSGVNLVFTGHMHIQTINSFTTEKGNVLYDVCTSALVGAPAMFRKITLKNNAKQVQIESIPVPPFNWDMEGLTNKEYFNRQFDSMINGYLRACGYDYEKFMRKLGKANPSKVLKLPVTLVGKFLNNVTLGKLGRLMFFKVDKSIRKVKVSDFAVEIVRNIFAGDAPYTPETPQYEAFAGFLKRIGFIIKKVEPKLAKNGKTVDLRQTLLDTIGNTKGYSDLNTVIDLA